MNFLNIFIYPSRNFFLINLLTQNIFSHFLRIFSLSLIDFDPFILRIVMKKQTNRKFFPLQFDQLDMVYYEFQLTAFYLDLYLITFNIS